MIKIEEDTAGRLSLVRGLLRWKSWLAMTSNLKCDIVKLSKHPEMTFLFQCETEPENFPKLGNYSWMLTIPVELGERENAENK